MPPPATFGGFSEYSAPTQIVTGSAAMISGRVADPTGERVDAIHLYRDLNGNGVIDLGIDQLLQADTTPADGYAFNAGSLPSGRHVLHVAAMKAGAVVGSSTTTLAAARWWSVAIGSRIHGEARFETTGELVADPAPIELAPGPDGGNWQDAVGRRVTGTVQTRNLHTQELYDYGFSSTGGAYAIGTARELRAAFGPQHGIPVAAGTKLIVLEDLTSATNNDRDYDDQYWVVTMTPVLVDLDVDSNNDDRLNSPKRDPEEEEQEATTPKKIVVNDNDTDDDDVPDYADWSIADKRFTPLVLEIPAGLPLGMMQIHVSYAASDPTWVGADHGLPANSGTRPLRIWTKNASQQRNPASVTAGGSFVPEGRIEDLTTLGFTDSIRTVELYVEGIRATAGVSKPISIELTVGGKPIEPDLVNVVVVSNTLVIGIDGTDQTTWLAGKNAKRPNGLWNSHVRNLIDDVWAFTMTDYHLGPTGAAGQDSTVVKDRMTARAEDIIADAGGGTTVAIVGWSRGAMIGLGVANALSTSDKANETPRTVAFVGMYDPVDESAWIPAAWHVVDKGVEAVTIVGPFDPRRRAAADVVNVDYAVTYDNGAWLNVEFTREAYFDKDKDDNWTIPRLSHAGGEGHITRKEYNASHGSIGGTPGYSPQHKEPPNGKYNYDLDKVNSFEADKDIRDGLRAAGFKFVPNRLLEWYGFFEKRPKTL